MKAIASTQPSQRLRISFDLYDTLIYRQVANPSDVFRIAADRLEAPFDRKADFVDMRVAAEKSARKKFSSRECNLDEIYQELESAFSIPADISRELKSLELAVERESTFPAPNVLAMLESASNEADEVWIVTDMYLPKSFIEEIVDRFGFRLWVNRVVVSNHEQVSKWSGELYRKLFSEYTDWRHFGDNLWSDVKQARRANVEAIHVPDLHPNNRERSLPAAARNAARLARLQRPSESDSTGWTVGANITGPLVFNYIDWIAKKAANRKDSKVVFIARDGQLLHLVYERFRKFNPDLPPSIYLYASRAAWLPSMLASNRDDAKGLVNWYLCKDTSALIKTIGLDPEELPSDSLELLRDERFWEAVQEHADLAYRYLEQLGLTCGSEILLVDIGWSGSMQKWLQRFLDQGQTVDRPAPKVIGLNYAVETSITKGHREAMVTGGTFFPRAENVYPSVVEMLLPADHGQTIGYRWKGDGELVEPQLSQYPIAPAEDIASLQQGALQFVENCLTSKIGPHNHRDLLTRFLIKPSRAEIDFFSRFRFCPLAREERPGDTLVPPIARWRMTVMAFSIRRHTTKWPWPEACLLSHWDIPYPVLLLMHAKMRVGKVVEKFYFAIKKRFG